MFRVAIGHSIDPDSASAIEEAIGECKQLLDGEVPQAGVLFTAIDFDHGIIVQQIQDAFGEIELIGGTTNGEVSSSMGFQQDSLTLMLFASDEVEIRAGLGREVSKNPITIAQQAVEMAKAKSEAPPQLCLTFPDSLTSNAILILEGLKQSLGEQIPIIGGMAADDYVFSQTYQFFQNEVVSDGVPVLLFCGDLKFSYGVASGWIPIGKRSCVTKVNGNVVYEIDGQRALDFYQYYLGAEKFTANYAIHALAVFEDGDRFYMRAPNGYDIESGSVTFFSDIPEGANVQITDASRENILQASETSLKQALTRFPGTNPAAALLVSCAARRRILGTLTSEEYQLVKNNLPQTIPYCGFYAYGEIAPLTTEGKTRFHNKTFVTLLIGENEV
ncbi:MAG: FIST N-terminal domain-containing protein [Cyanobacteria bacterium P01_D01_bin.50]